MGNPTLIELDLVREGVILECHISAYWAPADPGVGIPGAWEDIEVWCEAPAHHRGFVDVTNREFQLIIERLDATHDADR